MKISTFYFENYVIAYNYRILGDTTFIPLLGLSQNCTLYQAAL